MKARSGPRWLWASAAVLVGLGVIAWIVIPWLWGSASVSDKDYWPAAAWRTSTPEEQGLDSASLAEGLQALKDQAVAIDSLLIVRNGYVVLDAYFSPYDCTFPHDMASVTKSVMTTLIGIAVDQGKLRLDQTMVSFFPDRTIANLDDSKRSITVRDLVSNRNGMESGCFARDEPTLDAMRAQPDWVQAALDRKMTSAPGTAFCYDSPGMHLLSAILQKATGMKTLDFARQYLFTPLGIQAGAWEDDPQGYTHGWGDLHLKPEDAARIGYLMLQGGMWNGKQIVSSSWVDAATKPQSRFVGNEYAYGYGWWISPLDFYAEGRGGQAVRVIPSHNMVIVITGGGFDFGQLDSLLMGTLLRSRKELPPNPTGVAQLDQTVSALAQGSAARTSANLPPTAARISGRRYSCKSNPAGVTDVRLEFNDPGSAKFTVIQHGQESVSPIGLNGTYLLSPVGAAQRGYWKDSQTFILEVFDVGQLTRLLHYDGDSLKVEIPEAQLTLECQA